MSVGNNKIDNNNNNNIIKNENKNIKFNNLKKNVLEKLKQLKLCIYRNLN